MNVIASNLIIIVIIAVLARGYVAHATIRSKTNTAT
jgi:hypothetical protein